MLSILWLDHVNGVAESLRQFGWKQPIVIDSEGVIVAGHTRYKAALSLGMETAPCLIADDLTPEQVKAYRLADNKVGEIAEWDFDLLDIELENIEFDMSDFGFDTEIANPFSFDGTKKGTLANDFIIPPFSVLRTDKSKWRERKRFWADYGLYQNEGRDDDLMAGLKDLAKRRGMNISGTSRFDPVLCEVMYKWFAPGKGMVFDPFAGGAARGAVACMLGYDYVGIDLSEKQIKANNEICQKIGVTPRYIVDDSANMDKYIEDERADMILTCPPYGDLEKYSDDPRDLSNMRYEQFLIAFSEIMNKAVRKLKNNRFAVVVVGEIRDKKGGLRGFVSETERIMSEAGAKFYNEMILVDMIGTLPVRARKPFTVARKIGKHHQNVLCFYKGDVAMIKQVFPAVEFEEDTEKD